MDEYDSDGSMSDFENDFGLGYTGVELKVFGRENVEKSRQKNQNMMDKAEKAYQAAKTKFEAEKTRLNDLQRKQEAQAESDSKKEKLTDKVKKGVKKLKEGVGSVLKDIKQGSNASDEDVIMMIKEYNKLTKTEKDQLRSVKQKLFKVLAASDDIQVNKIANDYISLFNTISKGEGINVKADRARNLVLRFLGEREKARDKSRRGSQSSVDGSDGSDA